jgi:hypothetical protein
VAAIAKVFLMAGHAARTVPSGLGAMSDSSPCIIVVLGFFILVAFNAGIFAVTRKAVGIRHFGFEPMMSLPIESVGGIDGARLDVTHGAVFLGCGLVVVTGKTSLL